MTCRLTDALWLWLLLTNMSLWYYTNTSHWSCSFFPQHCNANVISVLNNNNLKKKVLHNLKVLLTFYTINSQFLLTESFLVADQFICAVQRGGGSRLGLVRQVLRTGWPVRQRGLDPVIGRGFSERRTLVPHGLSLNILTFWADRDPRPLVSGCCV